MPQSWWKWPQLTGTSSTMWKSSRRHSTSNSRLVPSLRKDILIRAQRSWMFKAWYVRRISYREFSSHRFFVRWCLGRFDLCVFLFFFLHFQGINNFNKAAKDLLQSIQKIDNDNYPEVQLYLFFLLWVANGFDIELWPLCLCFIVDAESYVHHQCWLWV